MREFHLNRALALVTEKDIDTILRIDAPLVASDTDGYISANKAGYYLACNTWGLLVKEYSPYAWIFLIQRITKHGLLTTIKEFDGFGDAIVHGEEVRDSLANQIINDVTNLTVPSTMRYGDRSMGLDATATVLLLFRFLKRFSPIGADLLQSQSIMDFKENERKMKYFQRRYIKEHKWYVPGQRVSYGRESLVYSGPDPAQPLSEYVVGRVREIICNLDWDYVLRKWHNTVPQDWIFTPGVSYEGARTTLQKLNVLAKQYPEYFISPLGIPYIGCRVEAAPVCIPHTEIPAQVVRIISVPKSYKAARIVAPEEVVRQMRARLFFSIIEEILPPDIQLRNQQQNAAASKEGSVTGKLATLDLSRASDCVTPSLVRSVFPSEVCSVLEELTARYWTADKRDYHTLQQFSTMGNSLTFVIESIVFWAICLAASEFHYLFAPEDRESYSSIPGCVSVYGDDCIVPTPCALECIEWLECCGFTVNISKSFYSATHLYRESCGEEWLEGIDCSSHYWPRKEIDATMLKGGHIHFSSKQTLEGYPDPMYRCPLESMIALQHRLYHLSQDASWFIAMIILQDHPRMTFSPYGSDIGDLWGVEAAPHITWAPMSPEARKGLDISDAPQYMTRVCHYVKSNIVPGTQRITAREQRILDNYRYQDFLRHGPVYLSELDKLLGISAPRISNKDAAGDCNAIWSWKKF